jgi:hypothetical protein
MQKLSKRKFLLTTTTAAAALCAWEPLVSICKGATTSNLADLNPGVRGGQ